MLIGDIWLRKRPPSSQHLLESGNLKFHPVVSAGQARRGDAGSYTGPGSEGISSSSIDQRYVSSGAARWHEIIPFCPETRLQMAARSGSAQTSSPASLLSSFPPLLLLRDWMPLCGVTNARSQGPGVHCAPRGCVRVRGQSARQG